MLKVDVKGSTVVWDCKREPACDREAIHAELTRLLPYCIGTQRPARGEQLSTGVIEALALDKTLTLNSLRVMLLLEAGWTAERIRAELKMPRQSWSDIVRALGHKRPINVRAVGRPVNQKCPSGRTAPQVKE
jgi:hypothetical protein